MALTKYFLKDVLAISQVLNNDSTEALERELHAQVVELAFDKSISKLEGEACFDLLLRLVTRLYPVVKVTDLSGSLAEIREFYEQKAKSINSVIELSNGVPTVTIVIGSTPVIREGNPIYYIGSESWLAKFSRNNPVGSGSSRLPFAAGAAACLAAANLFKHTFREIFEDVAFDDELTLSLVSLNPEEPTNVPVPDSLELGHLSLAGFGAVGNGFLWALSKLEGAQGSIDVVEPQELDLSNLQRYVLTEESHEDRPKIEIAKEVFLHKTLMLEPFHCDWAGYVVQKGDYQFEKVVVAVDSAKDRIAIQSSLPKKIFNGYTANKVIGISRHFDFTRRPCLACGYIPIEKKKDMSQEVADNLGLSIHERKVRGYLQVNGPVDASLLELISLENNVPFESLQEFEGQPITSFYSTVVCGGILMNLRQSDAIINTIEVPLAFQSTMAGILLASEVVLEALGKRKADFASVTQIYPLVPMDAQGNPYNHNLPKDATGRCLCQDEDFIEVFLQKWK